MEGFFRLYETGLGTSFLTSIVCLATGSSFFGLVFGDFGVVVVPIYGQGRLGLRKDGPD